MVTAAEAKIERRKGQLPPKFIKPATLDLEGTSPLFKKAGPGLLFTGSFGGSAQITKDLPIYSSEGFKTTKALLESNPELAKTILGDNFREAFPHIDTENLPPSFARFERVPQPEIGLFEINEGVVYQWVNGVVKDVWVKRLMTNVEKAEKTQWLLDRYNGIISFYSEEAQKHIDNANDELTITACQKWLDELNAWILVDIENPNFPESPTFSSLGKVVDLNKSGSAPNVIG